MFNESFPSFEERADLIRMEFDKRAPKIRLSIFAYLVEAGILGHKDMNTEEFIDLMAKVNEFISSDVEEYATDVAALEPELSNSVDVPKDISILTLGEDDPYGQGGAGSL
ncbi:hypothetical protein LCGC14_2211080 [marine sediment metagenome]|uniref:Uncharacterized protein n=1 Tax=marine sediment metagenome TaxID=412755 RepID=A0A0F9E192_9ZZZZ